MANKTAHFWNRCFPVAFLLLLFSTVGLTADDQVGKSSTDSASAEKGALSDEQLYDLLEVFADTMDQIDRNYVKEVDRRKLLEAAIRGMIGELDQYSGYIAPKDLDRFRTGVDNEFGGVGIQVAIDDEGLTVVSPLVGSPAYRAGLMAGDRITEIAGNPTKGITLDEAVRRMKGKIGTDVMVKVLHAGEEEAEPVKLRREIIRVETVLGDSRNDDDSWKWIIDDERKIGFLRITGFGRHTVEELRVALKQLQASGMKGLVLDLRFNPGGLLSSAIEVCDTFVSNGRIVSTKGRNTRPRKWDAHQKGTYEKFPMAILVNRYSASASEIVSACLQDHQRAIVIGERTWGKGSVQNIINLEEGASALKLTTASYHRPSGKNIHRFPDASDDDTWGVLPDSGYEIKLEPDELSKLMTVRRDRDIVRKGHQTAESEEFVDRQFEKAMEYIVAEIDGDLEPSADSANEEASDDSAKD